MARRIAFSRPVAIALARAVARPAPRFWLVGAAVALALSLVHPLVALAWVGLLAWRAPGQKR